METLTVEQEVRARVARKLRLTVSEVDHIVDTYVDEHLAVQREVRQAKSDPIAETIDAIRTNDAEAAERQRVEWEAQEKPHTVDQAVTVQTEGEAPTTDDVAAADELAEQAANNEAPPSTPRKRASRTKVKASE